MFHHVGSACCSEWLTETSVSAHWSDTFIARLQPTSLRVSAFSSENRLRRLEEIILSAAWSSVTAITVYLYSQYDCLEIMRCSWCPCRLCLCSCLLYVPTCTLLNSVSCRWFHRRGLVISGFLFIDSTCHWHLKWTSAWTHHMCETILPLRIMYVVSF